MKNLILVSLALIGIANVKAQTTYNWNKQGITADWNESTNWTPTRGTPAITDRLVINNSVNNTVINNIPTETIERLTTSGANAFGLNAQAAGATLTINGDGVGGTNDMALGGPVNFGSVTGLPVVTSTQILTINFTAGRSNTAIINSLSSLANTTIDIPDPSNCIMTISTQLSVRRKGVINCVPASLTINSTYGFNAITDAGGTDVIIPLATWGPSSTLFIGSPGSGFSPTYTNLNQQYVNFSYGSTSQAQDETLGLGAGFSVTGQCNFNSAGGNTLYLFDSPSPQVLNLHSVLFAESFASGMSWVLNKGSGRVDINVTGNFHAK